MNILFQKYYNFPFLYCIVGYVHTIYCNVAYHRQTNQSSTYDVGGMANGNSCNAVDGLENQEWSGRSCIHTLSEANPWWQVDFGDIFEIEFVNISVRTDNPDNKHYST